jgi:hypothetical protein
LLPSPSASALTGSTATRCPSPAGSSPADSQSPRSLDLSRTDDSSLFLSWSKQIREHEQAAKNDS